MTCSKGWKNRCPASRGKKCNCKCRGKNHGKFEQLPLFAVDGMGPNKDFSAKVTAHQDNFGRLIVTDITYEK